jgi:SAM-dependent methyltransferase
MQLMLDAEQLSAARHALTGPASGALIDLIFRLNLGRQIDDVPAASLSKARELGWVEKERPKLSKLGYLVADPLREYQFWLDRGRQLHSAQEYSLLAPESYRGKAVLEIGCGFGCNLFSLAGVTGRFVGVEPIALYRQFTPLLAEREGIEVPLVVDGRGEAVPFDDNEFDIVLCYSAHQYMDIRPAFKEMARVLKPGGQLRVVGGTLGPFTGYFLRNFFSASKWGSTKGHSLTVLNTLSYCLFGRRLYTPGGAAATTAPIYPPILWMNHWMRDAGLEVRPELFRRISGESCFVAEKRRAAGATS